MPDTTIVGGGIAGLAVARALALRGARVRVIVHTPVIREVGAGLQITPNGAAVLHGLGLAEPLAAAGLPNRAVELRDGPSGRPIVRLDMARPSRAAPWSFMHRADLVALLQDGARAAGVEITLGQQVTGVELQPEGAVLALADGRALYPELLIGADGLHSRLRRALNPQTAPFFTRQVAWRAIIPAGADAAPVAEVHLGAGRHLVSYPLRGGRERNIVAVEERDRWADDGWSQPGDIAELRAAFAGFGPRVQGWLARVEECWLWGLFRHPVAENWAWTAPAAPGRGVAILGDAAHPTLPFMAQGANMALEDGWVLAALLAAGGGDLAAVLADWQAARQPRCRQIVAAANTNARHYHLQGPQRVAAHLALRLAGRLAPGRLLARHDWIHNLDVTRQWP